MILGASPASTTIWASIIVVLSCFSSVVRGLRTAPGSPCEHACHKLSTDTNPSEIVCEDKLFSTTTNGYNFKECIECELDSTYAHSGESDVDWALYNLRFTLTSCIFGYPKQVVNISSPCVVACQPLEPALRYELTNPSALNLDAFCSTSHFADNLVDECELCYNRTTNQAFLANFAEAIRYNCHFQTPRDSSFAIRPTRIFSKALLPSTAPSITPTGSGGGVSNLTLVIALPILGFVLIACGTTLCCFFFIRWRRKVARRERQRQSSHLYARWNDTTISTPPQHLWDPQYQYQPGYGFGFVDADGRPQDVGYSKPGFVEVSEPTLPIAHAMSSPGFEKGPNGYF